MTGESSLFTTPGIPLNQTVCLADGSVITIRSKGTVSLSEHDGLYYFGETPSQASSLQASAISESSSFNVYFHTLSLWHARLGHVNFQYLCLLFLSLIKACKANKFQCEVCELSKHTRTSYVTHCIVS